MKNIIYITILSVFCSFNTEASIKIIDDNKSIYNYCADGYKYNIDNSYKEYLNAILATLGIYQTDIVLIECKNVDGIQYKELYDSTKVIKAILYEKAYLDYISSRTDSNHWATIYLFAHQIGIIINNSFNNYSHNHQEVLKADEFSGTVLAKLGATLESAKQAVKGMPNLPNSYLPDINSRILAIENGWQNARYDIDRLTYKTKFQTSVSIKKFLPKVENNEGYATIVGWATTYYARTILDAKAKNITNVDKITEMAYAPIFTYLQSNVVNDVDCSSGAYISKALEILKAKGAPLYKDFNYKCTNNIPPNIYKLAEKNKIGDFHKIFDKTDNYSTKLDAIKGSLSNGYPVIIGFDCYASFSKAKGVYLNQGDYDNYQGSIVLCVVGYDDNMYGGAVEIVNSWGADWGNNGFMWIPYKDLFQLTKYGYDIIPIENESTK